MLLSARHLHGPSASRRSAWSSLRFNSSNHCCCCMRWRSNSLCSWSLCLRASICSRSLCRSASSCCSLSCLSASNRSLSLSLSRLKLLLCFLCILYFGHQLQHEFWLCWVMRSMRAGRLAASDWVCMWRGLGWLSWRWRLAWLWPIKVKRRRRWTWKSRKSPTRHSLVWE